MDKDPLDVGYLQPRDGGEDLKARQYTDEEIRDADLRITDPYDQPDRVKKIPPGARLVDILNTYAFERWPEEKVRCVDCRAHRHKYGFTGLLDDGSRVLLGSSCGEEIFGTSWKQARNRLRDLSRRQGLLLRLDQLLPLIPELRRRLGEWHRTCERLEASRRRFGKAMPALYGALEGQAARGDARLMVYEKIRNIAAEEKATEDDGKPKSKWVQREAHFAAGLAYFEATSPTAKIAATLALLKEVAQVGGNTDAMALAAMRKYDRRLADALESLRKIAGIYSGSVAFFEPRNLAGVAAWATASREIKGRYSAAGRELRDDNTDATMALPENYPPLNEALVDLFAKPIRKVPRQ